MARFVACALLMLALCLHGRAGLIPSAYFLAEYDTRDVAGEMGLSVTPVGVTATAEGYELVPRADWLWYGGSVSKPFSERQPQVQSHALAARIDGPSVSAGLRLGAGFDYLHYAGSTDEYVIEGADVGGGEAFHKVTIDDVRHTRTDFSGTFNIGFSPYRTVYALTLGGSLRRHYGYVYHLTAVTDWLQEHDIWEYEPDEPSGVVTGGLMVMREIEVFGWPAVLAGGISGEWDSDHVPLHGRDTTGIERAGHAEVSYRWYGSLTERSAVTIWGGVRARYPNDVTKKAMFYRGRWLHGIGLDELSMRYEESLTARTSLRYTVSSEDTASRFAWEDTSRVASLTVYARPKIFITHWFSLSCDLSLDVGSHSTESGVAGLRLLRTGTTSATLRGAVNAHVPLRHGLRLDVSVHSGELLADVCMKAPPSTFDTRYYRGYLWGVAVAMIATM